MAQTDKLAYFLEADQLAGVFAEWPDDMNVVLCLEDSGDCEIVVYHRDEGHAVLRKVAAVFDRSVGDFMVVPEMRGYPTRKVYFSEEQKLLSLVADAIDLPETAQDYAINYRYARDQGLNPDTMKPRDKPRTETATVITPTFRHRKAPAPLRPAPEIVAKAARPAGIRPRLRLTMGNLARAVAPERDPAPAPQVAEPMYPPGYAPAAEFAPAETHVVEAEMFAQDDCIRLVMLRDRISVRTAPVKVGDLLFRDDFANFIIPRAALANWERGQAAVLDMPLSQFPEALARRFLQSPREAVVTMTAKGIFVAPGGRIANWTPIEAKQKPLLRRVVTPLRAAVLALVAVGAAAGMILGSVQEGQLEWRASNNAVPSQQADPDVTRFIGTPLDLIGTMAREAGQ